MIQQIGTLASPALAENVPEAKGHKIEDLMRLALDQDTDTADEDKQKAKEAGMKILMDAYLRELFHKVITEKPDEWEF